MTTKRLGKGLGELIDTTTRGAASFVMLRVEQIRPNRFQPRGAVSEVQLQELKASIARQGVIEPLIVRPLAHGTYEVVAGERRLRASQLLGLQEVPAIIKPLSDQESLAFSLVENIQRHDLNPVEEARGYARLRDEFGYSQEDIASAVGKDRATISNLLRLLKLPEKLRNGLESGTITLGHAKVLAGMESQALQLELYERVSKGHITVRELEELAGSRPSIQRRRNLRADPQLKTLEDQLRKAFGTKVRLSPRKQGGRIIIDYFSEEDLARIISLVGVSGLG